MHLVLLGLLPSIGMVRSAVKTTVTSTASYDSHTSPLGNLKAFLDEETQAKGSLESAKSSQMVCAKAGAEGPVLDSKSIPYSDNKSRSPYRTKDNSSSDTYHLWVLSSLTQFPHRQEGLQISNSY